MRNYFYSRLLSIASIFGIIGVSFGAFAAHFLKSRIAAGDLDVLKTGVLYLFIHTLAILAVVLLGREDKESRLLKSSGLLFLTGVILFSGSLFLLSTQSLSGINLSYFGIVTPVGGLCFIIGWILLLLYSFSNRT